MSITASRASKVLRERRNILASLTAKAGGTETARAPRGGFQRGGLAPFDSGIWRHHELRDLHAARDGESLTAVVDQNGRHFAAIIGIDGSRRVQHCHAMTKREPRTRAHLSFEPFRERQRDTGWHGGMA